MNAPEPVPSRLPELEAEQERCIRLTRMGMGMPIAGTLFWLGYAFLLWRFKLESAVYLSFAATGLVFPLGILFTRLVGGDLFAKSPALTPLGLLLAGIQLFYWPVIIVLASVAPAWTPYCMAVLFGSHFLPYGWLYRSKGYMLLAVLTAVATTVTVIVARGPVPQVVTLVAAACYVVSILVVRSEVAAVMRGGSAPAPARAAPAELHPR
jgi:uncharacterized protein DUF7010